MALAAAPWPLLAALCALSACWSVQADPGLARCADEGCQGRASKGVHGPHSDLFFFTVSIGLGRTTVRSPGVGPNRLAFKADENVVIFSKDDGQSGPDGLWGVEVRKNGDT